MADRTREWEERLREAQIALEEHRASKGEVSLMRGKIFKLEKSLQYEKDLHNWEVSKAWNERNDIKKQLIIEKTSID